MTPKTWSRASFVTDQVESAKPCFLSLVFIHQLSHGLQVSLPLFPPDWNATTTDYGSDMSLPLRIQVKLNRDYSSSTESVARPWWIKRASNSPVRTSLQGCALSNRVKLKKGVM
jgi:hypothetical protein